MIALASWTRGTGRTLHTNDEISTAIECEWQGRAEDDGYVHVSYFCSLASWACSITDILKQRNYDRIAFADSPANQPLHRQYGRLLLVASEVFDDLGHLYEIATECTPKQARHRLYDGSIKVDAIMNFVNRVVKHKAAKKDRHYHQCNFDLPIAFEDDARYVPDDTDIRVNQIDFTTAEKICMPRLADVVAALVGSYRTLDRLFEASQQSFCRACEQYTIMRQSPVTTSTEDQP